MKIDATDTPGNASTEDVRGGRTALELYARGQRGRLTPAAVSYQIKEIEDQLGVALFARTSRTIQLTPAGAVLLDATVDALESLRRAANRARKIALGSQLRISTGPRFATNWLLPRLPRFRAAHPDVEITFDISDQVRDFELDNVDVAIRFGAGRYSDARSERLFTTAVAPVCSPKLLDGGPGMQQPRDLFHHTLCYVDCKIDDMVWPNWRMWMAAAGIENFDDSCCIARTHLRRNLRVIDSLQLTDVHAVSTPAEWRVGDEVIIAPALGDEEARKLFPKGWHAPKPYLRLTADPRA